jgi:pimeloyl-ACP methyl ester carboxylesterase
MKMKLAQRVVIGYYKTKLRTIAMVSPRKAAEQAFQIFCTPYSRGVKQKEPPVFHKATRQEVVFEGMVTKGYQWKPEHANGQKLLIVHGFSSYSYKFEKYVQPLLKDGFEVLAFDAPAHGLSEGKMINALIYKRFLQLLEEKHGPINGFIAHSLGGLAVALLAEDLPAEVPRKMVLIAPATETRSAIAGFYTMFRIKENVQTAFEELIEEMTGKSVDYFSVKRVVQSTRLPILWIHDTGDRICPYKDTVSVQSLQLPHLRFMVTEGLGHNKIYRDKQVLSAVFDFFIAT